jgi:hypothetical protein
MKNFTWNSEEIENIEDIDVKQCIQGKASTIIERLEYVNFGTKKKNDIEEIIEEIDISKEDGSSSCGLDMNSIVTTITELGTRIDIQEFKSNTDSLGTNLQMMAANIINTIAHYYVFEELRRLDKMLKEQELSWENYEESHPFSHVSHSTERDIPGDFRCVCMKYPKHDVYVFFGVAGGCQYFCKRTSD